MRAQKMIKIIQDFEWYYEKGYITTRDGNACVRHEGNYLVTASGVPKHELDQDSYVIVDESGEVIQAPYDQKPSIETMAHILALNNTGKQASVHVHLPDTVALIELFSKSVLGTRSVINTFNTKWPELYRYTIVGDVVPYLKPGSDILHLAIETSFRNMMGDKRIDIVIMERHGVLAVGDNLEHCREHILRLEHISSILLKTITAAGGNLEVIL